MGLDIPETNVHQLKIVINNLKEILPRTIKQGRKVTILTAKEELEQRNCGTHTQSNY